VFPQVSTIFVAGSIPGSSTEKQARAQSPGLLLIWLG
jgi:hypothetical protein